MMLEWWVYKKAEVQHSLNEEKDQFSNKIFFYLDVLGSSE